MDQRITDFFERLDDTDAYWHKFMWLDLKKEDPELYDKVYKEHKEKEGEVEDE